MLGIYRVSQKNCLDPYDSSLENPLDPSDLSFHLITRSPGLWVASISENIVFEEGYHNTNLDNIQSQIFAAIFSGTPFTINMLMWGEGVDWATRPCGTCYLQWSNLFKSQRYYWGGGREYDKLWDILIFVTQSTSILTFKLESSCLICHKTFTNLPTFCRRLTGEQSFQSIFLVTLIKTKFQGNANNTWEKTFKKVSATVHHKANIYLSTKNSYIFNVNKHV